MSAGELRSVLHQERVDFGKVWTLLQDLPRPEQQYWIGYAADLAGRATFAPGPLRVFEARPDLAVSAWALHGWACDCAEQTLDMLRERRSFRPHHGATEALEAKRRWLDCEIERRDMLGYRDTAHRLARDYRPGRLEHDVYHMVSCAIGAEAWPAARGVARHALAIEERLARGRSAADLCRRARQAHERSLAQALLRWEVR